MQNFMPLSFSTAEKSVTIQTNKQNDKHIVNLESGPMPNVMAALPTTGGALCSTLQFG